MKLSVVLASHNRSASLDSLLRQLVQQVVADTVDWEVLVIDNNSTDTTRAVVAAFVKSQPHRFRYFFQERQGKSIAINTGILNASGEILVFTDDDCIPRQNWLASIANEFEADLSLSVLGGRVELYDENDKAVSIRTATEKTLVSSPDQLFSLLIGCNVAIHRRVFEVIKGLDPSLGPGCRTKAFEDLDFLYRAFSHGFKTVYSPGVLVYHNHGRRTESEVLSLKHNYLIGRGAFYCKHIFKADRAVLKMAYWEISSALRNVFHNVFCASKCSAEMMVLGALLTGAAYELQCSLLRLPGIFRTRGHTELGCFL